MLDYLFIGAHPDDIEIFAGGLVLMQVKAGYRVGILDLTNGEFGTYGNKQERIKEARSANGVLGISVRENAGIADGSIQDSLKNRIYLVEFLRKLRPEIVVSFSQQCRHCDHLGAHQLVKASSFLSGVAKYSPSKVYGAHRPSAFLEFDEPFRLKQPDFVIDITEVYAAKREAIECYATQVITGAESDKETKTFIRSHLFWQQYTARASWYGSLIGAKYGEGYSAASMMELKNPLEHYKRILK